MEPLTHAMPGVHFATWSGAAATGEVHHILHDDCLVAEGFGVAFGARVILADVSFSIERKSVTALVGPMGTGKSTLLRSIAGLNNQNSNYKWWGSVDYDGAVLTDGNRPQLVQQHVRLMQATVLDALTEGVRRGRSALQASWRDWAQALVERYNLPEISQSFDVPTFNLPPVMQRAVAILRAAALAPSLLMVDEPTSGLSDYDSHLLLDLLREVSAQSSVLVVLHNQKHARAIATDILMLAGGRIQESGDIDSFFEAPVTSAAQQYVKTGSCSVAAPDADPECLAEDTPPPPPLPSVALQAVEAAPESLGPRGFTWIIPGKLAGTPMPGAVLDVDYDMQALRRVGITKLITLTERDLPQEPLQRNGLSNLHLPIRDREPPTVSQTNMLLIRMEAMLRKGEVLAVHCLAGIGRTGTVLASYLIREGLTAQEALKRVRRVEPKFVQTIEQEEFLQLYEDSILKKIS